MKHALFVPALFVLSAPGLSAAPEDGQKLNRDKPFALVHAQGHVSLSSKGESRGGITLAVHGPGWSYETQGAAKDVKSRMEEGARVLEGTLSVPGSDGKRMEFRETVRPEGDRGLRASYRLRFPEAVRLFGYQVAFTFKAARLAGQPLIVSGPKEGRITVPAELGETSLLSGSVREVRVAPEHPEGFTITLDGDTPLLVQDNRRFGSDEIELRFNFRRAEAGAEVPAGETIERAFTVRYNEPMQVVLDDQSAWDETDTAGWVPYVLPWDSAPVDVSFLNEKPAGKRGFVTARGDRFLFEDGTEAKFWGTCFSAGANFPTHEQSEKIARRLAAFGVNMVRTHHADADWAENCFFDKTRDDTRHLNPETLDRFDYLVYCLKREGIYVYLDQLVNRKFKKGDGVDAVAELPVCGKPYSNFDPRLIELQKEFSRALWTHVNPYTKLAYKDDPAVALMEFANENDLFTQKVTLEPYRTRLEERYRAWAQRTGVEVPPGKVDFTVSTSPILRFLEEVQREYYKEMAAYLRGIGVRVPMTGSNWSRNAALLASLSVTDFTDSHSYWDHPSGDYRGFHNRPMVGSLGNVFGSLSFNRMAGKPFFVSEWDQPWPNEWRAEHPLAMAAVAALQSWNGLTTYTYRHSSAVPIDKLSGAFETFNDPGRFGLFPHAALLFRRGDVRPARERVTMVIPEGEIVGDTSRGAWSNAALIGTPETHRVQVALVKAPADAGRVVGPDDRVVPEKAKELVSDTGELRREPGRRLGTIETARTQAAYGFLGEASPVRLRDLELKVQTPFATVAVSSLTNQSIPSSRRLLLTAVARAENTGFRYNITHTRMLQAGAGPILIEPVRAEVRLRVPAALRVRPVLADGTRGTALATTYEEGWLSFTLGPEAKTIYYAIEE